MLLFEELHVCERVAVDNGFIQRDVGSDSYFGKMTYGFLIKLDIQLLCSILPNLE